MAVVVLAALVATTGVGAAEPQAPATTVPGVTVIAPKPFNAKEIPRPVIQDFVKSHGAPTRLGQLARWNEYVCPTTVGLPDAFNAFVSQRVRDVAASIGAPTRADCKTNIEIIFTTQPQALLDSIRKQAPVLLGFHYPAQLRRIATFSHPIQAWYATATRGASDDNGFTAAGAGQGVSGSAALDDSCCPMPGGSAGSRLTAGIQSEFAAVVIVADTSQVAAYSIGAIADDVAMMALSKTSPSAGCGSIASILDLTAPACGDRPKPEAMTGGDLAYLKALYAANLTNVLAVEQDSIVDHMEGGGAASRSQKAP